MKELSTEEKAKRYDEALDNANVVYKTIRKDLKPVIELIFPELYESEDERIRKVLVDYFERYKDENKTFYGILTDNVISWLEKQGEQVPVDKVESKFKVGDWVAYNHNPNLPPKKIIQITNQHYVFADGSFEIKTLETDWYLWTIKDAKAGDVLYYNDDIIVIFKYFHDDSSFLSYCYIDNGVFFTSNGRTPVWWINDVFSPANEEQRNSLFAKMKESGYEWDANKKELIKQMTDEDMLEYHAETIYDMSFEKAQDYINKRGFDIPWNDGDIMIDERKLTQTVANVLNWADRHPLILPDKKE